jgi:hypothetical protein
MLYLDKSHDGKLCVLQGDFQHNSNAKIRMQ